MTNDDDFLHIRKTSAPTEAKKEDAPPQPQMQAVASSPQIIERTMHTITTFKVYPNGQIFISKSQSWMDKAGIIVKPKEKQKPIEVQKSVLQAKEEY